MASGNGMDKLTARFEKSVSIDLSEKFRKDIVDANEKFLLSLGSDSAGIECTSEAQKELCITYKIDGNDNGAYLLKVLSAMVQHPWFVPRNKQSFSEEGKPGRKRRPSGQYLRVKITFPTNPSSSPKPKTITVHCNSSYDQPGNAEIHLYGSYRKHAVGINLAAFCAYFKSFLANKIDYPDRVKATDVNWKVAVLSLFEIARRIPKVDVHRSIPVAYGIQMAIELADKIKADDYFGLFEKTTKERMAAFDKISKRFYEAESEKGLGGAQIRQKLDDMMKTYGVKSNESNQSWELRRVKRDRE